MDDPGALRDRVTRLEERQGFDRERTDYHLADHSRRLEKVEATSGVMTSVMGMGSWLKLLAAVALFLIGLWSTGDIRAALMAARGGG